MHAKETYEQGGARTTFPLFGPDKNHPRDQNTWHRFPKLDMHKFEGSYPTGWVSQMEKYFHLHNIIDPKTKLKVRVIYLNVECFRWWQWHLKSIGGRPVGWTYFSKSLCARFNWESHFLGWIPKLKQRESLRPLNS